MDANFVRAEGSRRRFDRRLMDGEWPVLLNIIGKDGPAGRYLSLAELRTLYVYRTLPARYRPVSMRTGLPRRSRPEAQAAWAIPLVSAPVRSLRVGTWSGAGERSDDRCELVDVLLADDDVGEAPPLAALDEAVDQFARLADEGER
jgi:hypothetical protein